MVAALVALGHRRIAFLAGPRSLHVARERLAGYRRGLAAAGHRAGRAPGRGHDVRPRGRRAGRRRAARVGRRLHRDRLRQRPPRAGGDAPPARSWASTCPAAISVAGFDDISVAAITAPSLSTVRLPLRDLGRRGFELATLMLDGTEPTPEVLPTDVVLRDSTGPAPPRPSHARFPHLPPPPPEEPCEPQPARHHRPPVSSPSTPTAGSTRRRTAATSSGCCRRVRSRWRSTRTPARGRTSGPTSASACSASPSRRRATSRSSPGCPRQFTEQAVEEAKRAAGRGRRGLLVFPIPAYQGTPLDPAIPVAYHEAIARGCGLPMVAFQLQPALGGVIFSEETLRRIAAIDNVVALKEASLRRAAVPADPAHDREPAAARSTCSPATTTSSTSRS